MITIIDYGLGNIRAFVNVYERLNIKVKIAKTSEDLKEASKIILPGVGAFDHAMMMLNNSGMRETLNRKVFDDKTPIIGICVGMQMLAKSSDEGLLLGLCWIDGVVKMFDVSLLKSKTWLPHMGWNTINSTKDNPLLLGFDGRSRFYFLHSYYFRCNNSENSIAITEYGISFTSAVNSGNVYEVQFHPEKSHSNGIRLLYNFAKL